MQQSFFIHLKKKYVRISIDEIRYVLSLDHHVKIVTDHGIYIPFLTIKQLEKILRPDQFCRVNRSTLVALNRIISFDRQTVTLRDGVFSFSDKYRKLMEARIRMLWNADHTVTSDADEPVAGNAGGFIDFSGTSTVCKIA
ncbi:LytTR family transcriptional regulator [Terrimonas sp. NA20]|uniref:LytTR family transcriptional regulator n=1 Tax=Terrimonas ginsenosidimutans TaxID=2908004 RepID=A0ABS9KT78_9BACT|nr:LytTR family DNA-binding domain-containing protein [Terrimonas ginsenosidimutans]MCG2615528.1 LytTR family transcriptional regulator [Terrimonas ginsenosidimutans]